MVPKTKTKAKAKVQTKSKTAILVKPKTKVSVKTQAGDKVRVVNKISVPHVVSKTEERRLLKAARMPQYAYMKAPGAGHDFQVGDNVEVFCDHEKNRDRIRGWIAGVVVQVDNKMVAVQFRSNVFLTDGWMVPDRILWYPLASEHIRPIIGKKAVKREKAIPDY